LQWNCRFPTISSCSREFPEFSSTHDMDRSHLAHLPALILVTSHACPAPAAFANASTIQPLFPGRWFAMLGKKVATAYGLFRNGGVKKVYDYSWLRLQMLARGHMNEVRLDRCTFSLEGITDSSSRIQLITHTYEAPERRAVARYARANLPVVELGGSIGVVSCVTNKLLQNPTAHVVVEANPLAIPQLEGNRRLNNCQFEIVNRAIAYGVDSVTFRPNSSMCGNSITGDGDLSPVTVQTVRLGDLVRDRGFKRFTLICDIEGVEYDLVCQETEVLKSADTIIMETHDRFIGAEKTRLMMDKLAGLGFRLVEETEFVIVLRQ
jgi:FkbM family methyltransferase